MHSKWCVEARCGGCVPGVLPTYSLGEYLPVFLLGCAATWLVITGLETPLDVLVLKELVPDAWSPSLYQHLVPWLQ